MERTLSQLLPGANKVVNALRLRTKAFIAGLIQRRWTPWSKLIQHTVSRWCSSGCVHEGCGGVDRWLQTDHWSSWVCFYSRPIRQTSTECPLSPLQQLNFWMQISSQLSHFPNSNNDHCDLGFIVIACDVVRKPSRGHEVAMEDLRSKGGGGVCGPPLTQV